MEQLAPLLWFLTPLGFVAFWCFVCWVISLGGWRRLGKFQTDEKPTAKYFGMQSAIVGAGQYKGCLTIGLCDEGMYLKVLPLFAVGHPPLLIPWQAIERVQNRRLWRFDSFVLTVRVAQFKTVEITLYQRAIIEAIRQRVPNAA